MEKEVQSQPSNNANVRAIKQDQIHDLLFSREIGWQEIIYDLINTEQLDPWDINITILTDGYLARVEKIEEADFFVSSKVLLAAALLLRIKSEILLNKYIKSIDEILFGKKEEKKYETERIELDEDIPDLVPRSPVPRFKKVTLQELIQALNKAITTENRRIKKEIINRNALRETGISLPKKRISIKDRIKEIHDRLYNHFEENQDHKKVTFTDFIGDDKETRIISFAPLLHLENQKKVWLEQNNHFDEIHIWLKKIYLKHNPDPIKLLAEELEAELQKELDKEQRKRLKKLGKEFKNPIGE
jgi:segregation and condensation protein A